MELEVIESDLQSLRKLYGLLQSHRIGSQSMSSEYLDEKAQTFLRDLLDIAAERVFGDHSEFMAACVDVSDVTSTTQSERLKGVHMPRPHMMLHVSETSPEVARSSPQALGCNLSTAHENEQETLGTKTQMVASETANLKFWTAKPVMRRQNCPIPRNTRIEQQKSGRREKDVYIQQIGGVALENKDAELGAEYDVASKIKDTCDYNDVLVSKGIASTIKEIDSCIHILRLAADGVGFPEKIKPVHELAEPVVTSTIPGSGSASLLSETEQGMALCNESIHAQNSGIADVSKQPETELAGNVQIRGPKILSPDDILSLNEMIRKTISSSLVTYTKDRLEFNEHVRPCWGENQDADRNDRSMAQNIESVNQFTSQRDQTPSHGCKYVQGIRLSTSPSKKANATLIESQNIFLTTQNELLGKVGTARALMLDSRGSNAKYRVVDEGQMLNGIQAKEGTHCRTMASPIFYDSWASQGNGGSQECRKWAGKREKILPCQLDVRDASSSSVASSGWRSQRATTSSSDIEEYSQSNTQSYSYAGSTSYLDSDIDSYASQTSTTVSEAGLSSSSNEHNIDQAVDSASMSEDSIKNRRSPGNPFRGRKQTGRFRRLKDKLALVFLHHHHHHHHHHRHDGIYSDHKTKPSRGRALWKNAGKFFHDTGNTEKYGRQAAEKVRRSLAHKVPNKKQNGHFHALVKGLLKHVKKPGTLKTSKGGGIGKVGRSRHGHKKGTKKLHWWKMYQRQRAVKKIPKRPPVKIGFGTKEPRLRALPKLTSDDGEG